jgi:hypothetical protein
MIETLKIYFIFEISVFPKENWCSLFCWPECELVTQLAKLIFCLNFFNWIFNEKKLKIQYFLHLKSNNFQITFIKSYSSLKAFQQCHEHAQIPLYFLVLI